MCKKQRKLSNFSDVPPASKKVQTSVARKRTFSEKWLDKVPWLEVNSERTEMWCKLCRAHPSLADKTSVYFTGAKNFNHPVFGKHERSTEHAKIVEAISNANVSQQERSRRPLDQWQCKASEEQYEALTNIFLLAFHEAKHARPIHNYGDDIVLLKRLGVNVGSAYHSNMGGGRIIHTIADVIKSELREKLQAAEFWGLLLNGSEDITKTEQEIVYVVSVSSQGVFSSDFLGFIELGANGSAQDIVDGLVNLFDGSGLAEWRTKLISVCTDGAVVNIDLYNRVVMKLRNVVAIGDSLVHILCPAHTLENCSKSAEHAVPYCDTFNRCIVKVLGFYQKKGSAKALETLQKLCEEMGISFVKLGTFQNIRWSAWRHETVLNIWRLLPAIQAQISTTDDRDLREICTVRFHCFLAHMLDISSVLHHTSLTLQNEKLTLGECKDELRGAVGQFTVLLESDGKYREKVASHEEADRDKVEVLRALMDEFETRFESLNSCDSFLIFDPSTWPKEEKDIHSFDNQMLRDILQKYEATLSVDTDSSLREWMHLKQAGKHLSASSVYDLVNIVNTSDLGSYSNIKKLLLLSLTLPLSSAACERGFSHVNIIKNRFRSRLSGSRLSALMHIHMCQITTETFDPRPSVDLWLQTVKRRLAQGSETDDQSPTSVSTQVKEEELASGLGEDDILKVDI